MQLQEDHSLIVARRDLEDAWRIRSEKARQRYEIASEGYRRLLSAKPAGVMAGQDDPLALARREKAEASAEYGRILKSFTGLVIHGRLPQERLAAEPDGSQDLTNASLISVVDDDESIRDSTRTLLRSVGYEVAVFESGELFLESGTLSETRCLVLDIQMPGMSGLQLQHSVNLSDFSVPIIFVTAHDDLANRKLAIDAGASGVFHKPFSAAAFLTAVDTALKNRVGSPLSQNSNRTNKDSHADRNKESLYPAR